MILVILAIGIILFALGFILYEHTNLDEGATAMSIIGGVIGFASIAATIVFVGVLSKGLTIDERIEMYKTENQTIQQEVTEIVAEYMGWEKETYESFAEDKSPTFLVNLYPELKSDVLVSKQIDLYIANNQKIKELREEKIMLKPVKWWLYFGK